MRIEAFSEGKDLDDPAANEDQLLVLPGRGYAVIDGVTDISGRRYDGRRAGRVASDVVQRAVAEFLADPAEAGASAERLIERVSAALRSACERHGILDAARADPARRFGATLTLAVDHRRVGPRDRDRRQRRAARRARGDARRFRARPGNGGAAAGGVPDRPGGRRRPGSVPAGGARVRLPRRRRAEPRDAAVAGPLDAGGAAGGQPRALPGALPRGASADLERLLDRGIAGQGEFQNNTASPLSYALLDGFEVPMELVRVIDRPRASLRSIELFTDGYFEPGATAEVAAWETAFAEVERVDPEKIDRYPSVKGSTDRVRTDDRTIVIVHF